MVRLLRAFKELWLIVKGMIDALSTIFWASCLLLLCIYVVAIFCCSMIGRSDDFYSSRFVEPKNYQPEHFDAYRYYGTVPKSMFTLFQATSNPLYFFRPIGEKQPIMALPIFMFIFLTTFGLMNVIIGVIVDNTMQASYSVDSDETENL